MSLFVFEKAAPNDLKQGRLMQLAALFLLLYALALTLAPAARYHSWQAPYRWNHWIGFIVWLIGSAIAHRRLIQHLPERDPFIFPVVALLSGWGLLAIWRINPEMGLRQTIWLAAGFTIVSVGAGLDGLVEWLRRFKYLSLTGSLLLTALTFLLGTYPGGVGPRLWLGCCGVYLQPSEPLKLLLIVYLSAYLADRLPLRFSLPMLLAPTLILMGAALGLLVAQRDLGTASLFILIYTAIVYMASGRKGLLIFSWVVLFLAVIAGYRLFDVVRIRVDAWLNPWLDPSGRSFQIVQSILAVASGGIVGRGPGLGSPGVVPVAHSDFIFAAISEETGLLGAAGLLLLIALLVGRGFLAAMYAPSSYRRSLAAGITTLLAAQSILIAGGNLRLLPLTGVTLPFVSYGGSSLLTSFLAILLLLRISHREDEQPAPLLKPESYLLVSGGLLTGLAALALTGGWWGAVRSESLLLRNDNPRWSINDRFVRRGALLDRNNTLIDHTTGVTGSYQRIYEYPPLSNTIGYISGQYGLAGLETSLDSYLRGLRGNPSSLIWWQDLVYGQPPPGLNVRLTLDLALQRKVDPLLEGRRGAVILINSSTGEILVLASHPYPQPETIETNWQALRSSADAPLLNRATQGEYPPGTALGPFLLAYAAETGALPPAPEQAGFKGGGRDWTCALPPAEPVNDWGNLIAAGCPGALAKIGQSLGSVHLAALFRSLGFQQAPDLPLMVASPRPLTVQDPAMAAIGQENLVVTPLQMALAAAALNNQGLRPAPQIAAAIQTPYQGWAILASGNTHETLLTTAPTRLLEELLATNAPYWQVFGTATSNQTPITWYLAGTRPEWQGVPLTVVVVLEEDNPDLAQKIGETLLGVTTASPLLPSFSRVISPDYE